MMDEKGTDLNESPKEEVQGKPIQWDPSNCVT